MLSREKIKGIFMGLIIATFLFASVFTVFGSNGTGWINVSYRNIVINVNGSNFTPTDANGNYVEPFIFNGTTYLPARAVSEALGKNVVWDNDTSTIYISDTSSGSSSSSSSSDHVQYMSDILTPYSVINGCDVSVNDKLSLAGKAYNKGYHLTNMLELFTGKPMASFNLDGNYTRIKGKIGTCTYDMDNTEHFVSCKVGLFGDKKLLAAYSFTPNDLPQDVDIDVTGVKSFEIVTEITDDVSYDIDFCDATIE